MVTVVVTILLAVTAAAGVVSFWRASLRMNGAFSTTGKGRPIRRSLSGPAADVTFVMGIGGSDCGGGGDGGGGGSC